MRTALRTALATALVAGVAATPVLAAGSAFAAGTAPAPKPAAAAPAPAGKTAGAVQKPAVPTGKPAVPAAKPVPAAKTPGKAAGAAAAPAAPASSADTPVRTVRLAGGMTAQVFRRGDQHPYYTATVQRAGRTLGELKAGAGYPAKETKVFAGYAVTLDFGGTVTAVAAGTGQGTLVGTRTLIGGTVAKIYKVNALHHRAELFRDGHRVGVLDANTRPAAGNDNGEFLVLHPEGGTHNWVGNYRPGATPGIYRLADGTVLELVRTDGRYGLRLAEGGEGRGVLYVNGDRAAWTFGKAVVVLERDGGFAAYIPGSAKQAAPQPYGMGGGGQGQERPVDTDPDALGPCTVTTFADIGAGTEAKLIMSPKGPKAKLITAGDDKVVGVLDRAHPSLPASAGIVARIVDAYGAAPKLYTKTQGGVTGSTHAFPKLPKGCVLNAVPGAQGGGAAPQGGQTSVIPRGGVAAGAELAAEDRSAVPAAAGVGAASLAAAGLVFTVLRRRAAGTRG